MAATIQLTTGLPGAGKTYVRCARFLADVWLPDSTVGTHISNFPVVVDALAERVGASCGGRVPGVVEGGGPLLGRVELFPREVLDEWRRGNSGPWEYFRGRNLEGCHIAIDEAHEFCGKRQRREVQGRWEEWLATIRHEACTIEFVTQDVSAMSPAVVHRCGRRVELVSASDERDPFFRVPMEDYYQVRAGFTGTYRALVFEIEYRRVLGRWVQNHAQRWELDPAYYGLYESYSRKDGTVARNPLEFEKRGRVGVLLWFVRRNWLRVGSRLGFAVLVFWLTFGGLGTRVFGGVCRSVRTVLSDDSSLAKQVGGDFTSVGPGRGALQVPSVPSVESVPAARPVMPAPVVLTLCGVSPGRAYYGGRWYELADTDVDVTGGRARIGGVWVRIGGPVGFAGTEAR